MDFRAAVGGEFDRANGAGLEVLEMAGVLDGEFHLLVALKSAGGEPDPDIGTTAAFSAALEDFDLVAAFGNGGCPHGSIFRLHPVAERVLVRLRFVAHCRAKHESIFGMQENRSIGSGGNQA